jgi:hypothetical protein
MKKGKASALVVLVVEIATISVLHAVKINHSEKAVNKDTGKTISILQEEAGPRTEGFTMAVYKYFAPSPVN